MPLESIGSYAVAGSTGANARGARQSNVAQYPAVANDPVFATSSARGGNTGGSDEQQLASNTPNVAVYLSPFIRLDIQTRLAIVEFRDSQTGAVKQQYPSPRVVEEYRQNLPESSDLLQKPTKSDTAESQRLQPQIIGPNENSGTPGQPGATTGTGDARSGTGTSAAAPAGQTTGTNSPAPAPAPAPLAQAAAAAFGAARSAAAPSRELAIA